MLTMQKKLDLDMEFMRHIPSTKRISDVAKIGELVDGLKDWEYRECLYSPVSSSAVPLNGITVPEKDYVISWPCSKSFTGEWVAFPNYYKLNPLVLKDIAKHWEIEIRNKSVSVFYKEQSATSVTIDKTTAILECILELEELRLDLQ